MDRSMHLGDNLGNVPLTLPSILERLQPHRQPAGPSRGASPFTSHGFSRIPTPAANDPQRAPMVELPQAQPAETQSPSIPAGPYLNLPNGMASLYTLRL